MSAKVWAPSWDVEAVLVEVDGVVVDTMAAHQSTWRWWAQRVGVHQALVEEAAWGLADRDAVAVLAPGRDLDTELEAIRTRRQLLLRTTRRVRGAISMIRSLPPRRWAVVSSATAEQTAELLDRVRLSPPSVVITASDAGPRRPTPWAHIEAAARLGYPPAVCAAFESSPSGVLAARAADAVVVAVGHRRRHAALAGADAVRSDLGGIQIQPLGDGRLRVRAFREPQILR